MAAGRMEAEKIGDLPPKAAVEIVEEEAISADLEAKLCDLLVECFKWPGFRNTRHSFGAIPTFSVIHRAGAAVFGNVSVHLRTITCGPCRLDVAGIGNVAVAPAMRGRGLFPVLMRTAIAEAQRRARNLGLLFCRPELEALYGRLGWKRREGTVWMTTVDSDRVPLGSHEITMVLATGDATFPEEGEIDLLGPRW